MAPGVCGFRMAPGVNIVGARALSLCSRPKQSFLRFFLNSSLFSGAAGSEAVTVND